MKSVYQIMCFISVIPITWGRARNPWSAVNLRNTIESEDVMKKFPKCLSLNIESQYGQVQQIPFIGSNLGPFIGPG